MENIKKIFLVVLLILACDVPGVAATSSNSAPNTTPYNPEKDAPLSLIKSPSRWYEYNEYLYSDLLINSHAYNMLVLPLQVRDNAIDVVGRSLMAKYLASSLTRDNAVKIPDVDLVEKALGEHLRRYDIKKVFELANDLGVNKIVAGYVGHNGKHELSLSIFTYKLDSGSKHFIDQHKFNQKDWNNIKFSDEELPSEIFLSKINEITKFVRNNNAYSNHAREPIEKLPTTISANLSDFAKGNKIESPLLNAYYFQLIGLLQPKVNYRRRERLFEKSLVALTRTSHKSKYYDILKARAYYYLHRRPAGLFVLKNSTASPEKQSLKALLNGNFLALQESGRKIKHPLIRELSLLETYFLFDEYNSHHKLNAAYNGILTKGDWTYFRERSIHDLDPWAVDSNYKVKRLLDNAFPVDSATTKDSIVLDRILKNKDSGDVTFAVVEHIKALFSKKPSIWCCNTRSWKVTPWDYLNLLDGIAESNLIKHLTKLAKYQDSYSSALNEYERLKTVYQGHPQFSALAIKALFGVKETKNQSEKQLIDQRISQLVADIYGWANGQQEYISNYIPYLFRMNIQSFTSSTNPYKTTPNDILKDYAAKSLYATDFPVRPYWEPLQFRSPEEILSFYKNAMNYSSTEFYPVEQLKKNAPSDYVEQLAHLIANRFQGLPERLEMLAQYEHNKSDLKGEIKVYEDAVNGHTYAWIPYLNLGQIYINHGQYNKAKMAFQKFPLFENDAYIHNVEASNRAYHAGNLFFKRGEIENAAYFYKITAATNTGSSADYGAKFKLALINGDYTSAVGFILTRARRYNDAFDYGYFMYLLHVLGEGKAAWNSFESLLNKASDPYLWLGPFIGHRIEKTPQEKIVSWAMEPDHVDISGKGNTGPYSMSVWYLFQAFAIDRAVTAASFKAFEKFPSQQEFIFLRINQYLTLKSFDKDLIAKQIFNSPQMIDLRHISDDDAFWFPYQMLSTAFYSNSVTKYFKTRMGRLLTWADNDLKQIELAKGEPDYNGRFNYYLALSIYEARLGDYNNSLQHIKNAFYYLPTIDARFLPPLYQLTELCEWLSKLTGKDMYLNYALQLVEHYKRVQIMHPWSYAFEAKYSKNPKIRQRSLGYAMYLDPGSYWISTISTKRKQNAKKWFKSNNPFEHKKPEAKNGV